MQLPGKNNRLKGDFYLSLNQLSEEQYFDVEIVGTVTKLSERAGFFSLQSGMQLIDITCLYSFYFL